MRWRAGKDDAATPVVNGPRAPGKVATFSRWEPGIGFDLITLPQLDDAMSGLVETAGCCGVLRLELADLDGVARHKNVSIPVPAK